MAQSQGLRNVFKLRPLIDVMEPKYGAKGDIGATVSLATFAAATDDTAAINAALAAAAAIGVGVVTTPPNRNFKITSQVTKPQGVSFQMGDGSSLIYDGIAVALRLEPDTPDAGAETYSAAQFNRRSIVRVERLAIEWQDAAGNVDTTSVGIEVVNSRYSHHDLHAVGFYNNINLRGVDTDPRTGTVYAAGGAHVGNLYRVYSRNSKLHILETRSGATGYVNSNKCDIGLMRNDGSFAAAGSRGFDGSAGANGWTFDAMNVEGANIEQIFRFAGPKNVIMGCRFESATDGMVKVLNGGGVVILGGYIGTVGRPLVSCDAGGVFVIVMENGSWFSNAISANACLTGQLTGASGFFHQWRLQDGKIVSESQQEGRWLFYTTAGKFHAVDNPTGLTNPTFDLNAGTRNLRFRGSSDDAAADGTATALSWGTANNLSLFRCTLHLENCSHTRPIRMGGTVRFWEDANGSLRWKNSAPSSDTDGRPILTNSVSADKGDAAATLTVVTSEETNQWNTPIGADRAVTLSTTGATNGMRFRIVRTAAATGAFNLNVGTGPLKALTAGQWCVVEYNGSAWMLTGFGSL